jgi:hydroxymethylglutaryl-CoA reductase
VADAAAAGVAKVLENDAASEVKNVASDVASDLKTDAADAEAKVKTEVSDLETKVEDSAKTAQTQLETGAADLVKDATVVESDAGFSLAKLKALSTKAFQDGDMELHAALHNVELAMAGVYNATAHALTKVEGEAAVLLTKLKAAL